MPRKKKRYESKKVRHQWDKAQMELAIELAMELASIEAVRAEKMSIKGASKHFSVPRSTLQRLVRLQTTPKNAVEGARLGRKTLLPPEMEQQLVSYLLEMERNFFGYTSTDVKRMGFLLAQRNGLETPFKDGIAGRAWVDLFLERHKGELQIRTPSGKSCARALGFNKVNVNAFLTSWRLLTTNTSILQTECTT